MGKLREDTQELTEVMFSLVSLLLALAAAQNINTCPGSLESLGWCDCAPADSGVVVSEFSFSPDPIQPGKNVSGVISVTDKETAPITGGSIGLVIEYLGIPLVNQTVGLCQALAEAHAKIPEVPSCPLPPSSYTGTVSGTDQTNRIIQCVQFKMKIV